MVNGWIVYNGNLKGDKFRDIAEWLHQAATKRNSKTKIIKNNDLLSVLSTDKIDILRLNNISLPDYVLFFDKDIYLAKQLEALGIQVFNNATAIQLSDDKIATYQKLAINNLPIPKTIVAPKVFQNAKENYDYIQMIQETFTYPMIIKEAYGSFGEQVYLVHNEQELIQQVSKIKDKPFMFQQFIKTSFGKDIRLHVVGDQVVAAMKRTSKTDFRANVTIGGAMEKYDPSMEEKDLAIAATRAIGADFAGVDLLFGEDHPIICEVNSNAHIRNIYECTSINIANYIVDYVLKEMKVKRYTK